MSGGRPARRRITSKLPLDDLDLRLELLLKKQRHIRIRTLTDLEWELHYHGRIQWHRRGPGRCPGIPAQYVSPFLRLFGLTRQELQLPLPEFERLLDASGAAAGAVGSLWSGVAVRGPLQIKRNPPGSLFLGWPAQHLEVRLRADSCTRPLVPPFACTNRLQVYGDTGFHIDVQLSEGPWPRMLGVIEGEGIHCFHLPGPIGASQTRRPPGGPDHPRGNAMPYCFQADGRHLLSLLMLGDLLVDEREIAALAGPHTHVVRETVERIARAASRAARGRPLVLRAELDVVPAMAG